jgi:hypothetical protein
MQDLDRRSFLKFFGLGALAAPIAGKEIVKVFDSNVAPPAPLRGPEPQISLPSDIAMEGPYSQFRYLLGHDRYCRLILQNQMNGKFMRYDKNLGLWVGVEPREVI